MHYMVSNFSIHLKPDFTLWLIQKYFDLLVGQINIWTANCERAAAVILTDE